ncbi:MAG: cytochrome b N-terminal domain-containing protein [Actinomycetes bacterium]
MDVDDKLREGVERGETELLKLEDEARAAGRAAEECGMGRVLIDDDPAKLPPELRNTLDGRARRWFLRTWPPQQLAPDAEPVFVRSWFYTMGVCTLACLITLFITGLLLALFGPEWWLTNRVGQFVDQMHYWAVVTLFLFMTVHWISVFFMGSFRGRRFTWMLGVVSLLACLVTAFTGYASLQDFESQWITTQGKDAINSTGIGAFFNLLNTGQMLTVHVVLLPMVVLVVVAVHLLLVRKHGIAPPYDAREDHLAPEREATA